MGMTDWQILKMVELPLAAPVILTGIRVAVVIAVGVATIAAAVGAGGLGTYIFRGLRQNDNNLLLAGAIFSALLALLADFALGQIEKIYSLKNMRRSNKRSTQKICRNRRGRIDFARAYFSVYFQISNLKIQTLQIQIKRFASARKILPNR